MESVGWLAILVFVEQIEPETKLHHGTEPLQRAPCLCQQELTDPVITGAVFLDLAWDFKLIWPLLLIHKSKKS